MKEIAIRKVNAEMQKRPDDKFLEIIGHYIIDRCLEEHNALQVGSKKEPLTEAVQAIEKRAVKARRGDMAVLTPAAVFGAVDEYFGFVPDERAMMSAMGAGPAPEPKAPKSSGVVIDLSDFF